MIFVLSQQAAASAFSGSNRACNLIFLGKPPFCGLGLVGGLAELCNGILSFCNILECDEILPCPPDCILLHAFEDFFFFNWTLPGSFPSYVKLPTRQLAFRGGCILFTCFIYGDCRCPLKDAHIWDTNRATESGTMKDRLCIGHG